MTGEEMRTDKMIAYCGVDCSECDDYKNNKCPSCRLSEWTDDDICRPVKCCIEKGIEFCSECDVFPCKDMKDFYEESESHREAFTRLVGMSNRIVIPEGYAEDMAEYNLSETYGDISKTLK